MRAACLGSTAVAEVLALSDRREGGGRKRGAVQPIALGSPLYPQAREGPHTLSLGAETGPRVVAGRTARGKISPCRTSALPLSRMPVIAVPRRRPSLYQSLWRGRGGRSLWKSTLPRKSGKARRAWPIATPWGAVLWGCSCRGDTLRPGLGSPAAQPVSTKTVDKGVDGDGVSRICLGRIGQVAVLLFSEATWVAVVERDLTLRFTETMGLGCSRHGALLNPGYARTRSASLWKVSRRSRRFGGHDRRADQIL